MLESFSTDSTLSAETCQGIADNIKEMILLLQASASRIDGTGVKIDIPSDITRVPETIPEESESEDTTEEAEIGKVFIVKVNDAVRGYAYSESDVIEYINKYTDVASHMFSNLYCNIHCETSEDGRTVTIYGRTRWVIYEHERVLTIITCEEVSRL